MNRGNCKLKRKPRPPKTQRYCQNCERETTWEYNPRICHSECSECGMRNIGD